MEHGKALSLQCSAATLKRIQQLDEWTDRSCIYFWLCLMYTKQTVGQREERTGERIWGFCAAGIWFKVKDGRIQFSFPLTNTFILWKVGKEQKKSRQSHHTVWFYILVFQNCNNFINFCCLRDTNQIVFRGLHFH